jgi:hypothetical protein
LRTTVLPSRQQAVPCPPENISERTDLTLPSNVGVKTLPHGANFSNMIGRYQSSYSLQNHTIIATRLLVTHPSSATCNANDYAQLKALSFVLGTDLRSGISY